MKRISLIANSSIQYHKFDAEIDLDFGKNNKVYYHEPYDSNSYNFILDPLVKFSKDGQESFYRVQELVDKEIIVNGKIKDETDISQLSSYGQNFEENNLKKVLKNFQKKWIPLPFFKENSINKDLLYPTDWVRLFFECDENFKNVKIVLAIDTSLAKNESDKTSPSLNLNPEENIYKIQTDELNLSVFLFKRDSSVSWIEKYLADIYYGKNDELRYEKPVKQYAGGYIMLMKWLSSLVDMPELQIFTNNVRKKPVDLVIDIGNSATCALLFESKDDSSFEFKNVKKLLIQDYTNPHNEYSKPFPMNLIFSESKFGDLNNEMYHNNKFTVPSLVRIGFEAESLINKSITDLSLGYELKTYNSSPKRYLWDNSPSEREWEFNPKDIKSIKKVYLNGISEQIKANGELITGNELFGSKPLFSRSSLMKFVFLELIIHAYVQINSYSFRKEHGDMTIPRTLKRITISCPTGMIQHEQIALRKAAEDACKLLNNYVNFYFDNDYNNLWFELPEIIPSIKDISKNLSQLEEKKDWIYDEATSSQLVFIYSLFAKKLKGNNYVIDHYLFKNKDSITVGSIDIGAGTTDIMINKYTLKANHGEDVLKPFPLFWDTFKNAGDDILREIIQKNIIEGIYNHNQEVQCEGGIGAYARSINIPDVSAKLNGFFGEDSNKIGFKAKVVRKAFIHQVAVPIALEFLNNANNEESYIKTFEEIIDQEFKNTDILNYFERHFGFNFTEIKWKISPEKVNNIVNAVFDSLIRQICVVMNQYQCDYVVLSGKPASLNSFENLFKKYLSTSPNNLVNLNNYWIGRWYPFADNNGYIEDPKTVVCVGATIAVMAGKLMRINDLKIDTTYLAQNLVSTADYIVDNQANVKKEILTPRKNEDTITVNKLPFQFGYSKYLTTNYPFSDLYSIGVNDKEIEIIVRMKYPGREERYYENQINVERNSIFTNLPLKVTLSREFDESKEKINIVNVEDSDGNDKYIKYFSLNYQTLHEEAGFWLDTCEFTLNVKN
ncbi:virulence factor SrfB [Frigoriflavimonas asaccharolytica]|uniref:Virulence factor SrfB n=1 Tax=Frigoriflavimonas asaccharolytica TaxID=2735899 RepID=A0A8J8GBN5_9FLAO|nr:virulence factor SrfB [Frigoriflavimonas asaccharolytica]NRS93582.1 hypothetical protein [Frigoriflavimonas asaccharolytica]